MTAIDNMLGGAVTATDNMLGGTKADWSKLSRMLGNVAVSESRPQSRRGWTALVSLDDVAFNKVPSAMSFLTGDMEAPFQSVFGASQFASRSLVLEMDVDCNDSAHTLPMQAIEGSQPNPGSPVSSRKCSLRQRLKNCILRLKA